MQQTHIFLRQILSFSKKQYISTVDGNSGSYPNGQIKFDCAQLSNSGGLIDWANTEVVLPVVIRATGLDDDASTAFAISLKNHCHVFDSMTVQISNHTVVEICDFSSVPVNFKILSQMSYNELAVVGPSIGYYKDNAHSVDTRALGATGYGFGECNNIPNGSNTTIAGTNSYGSDAMGGVFLRNGAMMDRMIETSFDVTGNATVYNVCSQNGKNMCVRNPVAADTSYVTYYCLITMPLKYLSDFFDKLPLMRNAYMSLTFNTNLNFTATLTKSAAAAAANGNPATVISYSAVVTSGSAKICPFNISPISQGVVKANPGNIKVEVGLTKLLDGTSHPALQQCRLYSPIYTLNPVLEQSYFSNPIKEILYSSYYYVALEDVAPAASLNSRLLHNGVSRLRSVLVVPVVSAKDASQNNLSPLLSPFSSCPTTTAQLAYMSNFNIRVAGSPHYLENINYGFQHFNNEIRALSLNGGLDKQVGSGLLNFSDWNAAYRFIYVNLSRKDGQGMDDVAKAVTIDGKNDSGRTMTYHVFIEYQKVVHINISTGQLINQ